MFFKTIAALLLVVAVSTILYSKQELLIEQGKSQLMLLDELKPVNPKIIKPFLLGHEAFYADVFWIDTIQKSVELNYPNLFSYVRQMVDLITDLDPRFSQVYIWSNTALEYAATTEYTRKQKVEIANEILIKGWDYVQQDAKGWNYFRGYWMIAQIIAYNYGFELKDKEKALEYMSVLMYVPNLPPHLKTWAAGLYRKSKEKEKGIQFLENLLAVETIQSQIKMMDDRDVKEKLKGKLLAFYKQLNKDDYGRQRIAEIQRQVKDMIDSWRAHYLFLPLSFYTLIHGSGHGSEQMESDEMYSVFFPHLSR